MSVLVEPGHNNVYPLRNTRILYENVATSASATGSATNYPASAVLTEATYERWRPAVSGDSITVTFPEQVINAIGIAAHSNLSPTIEVFTNGAWEAVSPYPAEGPSLSSDFAGQEYGLLDYSADNEAMLWLIKPRRATSVRVTVTYTGAAPTIGVIQAGTALEIPRPFYGGHQPAMLTSDTVTRPNTSESGEWLGASLIRKGRPVSMSWDHLPSAWVRRYWQPFAASIKTRPFIAAWNPLEFPADCLYCTSDQQPAPSNSGPGSLQSVSIRARGYSDGTEPEVKALARVLFSEMWDFTRGSEGTYWDFDGVLKTAAVDEPRFDHDPVTGEALGLLIEEQRTNVHPASEDLSNASFYATENATVTVNTDSAPDGTLSADSIQFITSGGFLVSENSKIAFPASTSGVATVYLKDYPTGAEVLVLNGEGQSLPTPAETVLGAPSAEWTRVEVPFTSDTDGFIRILIRANAVTTIKAWGVQIEAGSFPTSYIKTTTAQATRSADNCSRTLGAEFNLVEGTIYAESRSFKTSGLAWVFETSDRSPEVFYIADSNVIVLQFPGFTPILAPVVPAERNKIAVSISPAKTVLFAVNGSVFNGQGAVISGNLLRLGQSVSDTERALDGQIQSLSFYPRALSAAELQALTAP